MTSTTIAAFVAALAVFCLWHAWITVGPRRATAFLVTAVVISWTLEELGVVTGLVYGGYHYTPALGPQLGSVPVLIPLTWFALAYPTFVLVGEVAGRWGPASPRGRTAALVPLLAGALLMTAWDLALDPILSGPTYGAWVWEGARSSGGVPAQNYLGWLVTAFAILLAFRALRWSPGLPLSTAAVP